MHYLYGLKPDKPPKLVATFDGQQQLLAYVRWATLGEKDGVVKFAPLSPLIGYQGWSHASVPQTNHDAGAVVHNPFAQHVVIVGAYWPGSMCNRPQSIAARSVRS